MEAPYCANAGQERTTRLALTIKSMVVDEKSPITVMILCSDKPRLHLGDCFTKYINVIKFEVNVYLSIKLFGSTCKHFPNVTEIS